MAPKAKATKNSSSSTDPHGIFSGMVVFLVEKGVQARRLQVPLLTRTFACPDGCSLNSPHFSLFTKLKL